MWSPTVERDKHFVYSVNGSVNTILNISLRSWGDGLSNPSLILARKAAMAVRRVPTLVPRRTAVAHGARALTSVASKSGAPPAHAPAHPAAAAQARGLATAKPPSSLFASLDTFADRHIGPEDQEVRHMLKQLGYDSVEAFVADTVPPKIRVPADEISNESIPALSESELHNRARELARANKPFKSYIGMGYHNAVVPPVILRNVSLSALSRVILLTLAP